MGVVEKMQQTQNFEAAEVSAERSQSDKIYTSVNLLFKFQCTGSPLIFSGARCHLVLIKAFCFSVWAGIKSCQVTFAILFIFFVIRKFLVYWLVRQFGNFEITLITFNFYKFVLV